MTDQSERFGDPLVAFTATGERGSLYAGYQPAGSFGAWELRAKTEARWQVTARDEHLHGYYAEHASVPLTVRLELGLPGYWEAPVEILATTPLRLRGLAPVTAHDREES